MHFFQMCGGIKPLFMYIRFVRVYWIRNTRYYLELKPSLQIWCDLFRNRFDMKIVSRFLKMITNVVWVYLYQQIRLEMRGICHLAELYTYSVSNIESGLMPCGDL